MLYFDEVPIEVIDTVKENDLILHITKGLPSNLNDNIKAVINANRRKLIENNHTATHLLHSALRNVLGTHVQQKGSLVQKDYLRFDFSHFQKVTKEEISMIESLVNEKIRENIPLQESRSISIEEAQKAGAMMLFGEKYGEKVRMITFDPMYSVELCGGCHVQNTAKIGFFKIIAESAVAAGVRRIEAITSNAADEWLKGQLEELSEIKLLLNNPKDIRSQIQSTLDLNKELQKEMEELKLEKALSQKAQLINEAIEKDGVKIICRKLEINDGKIIKNLAYSIGKEMMNCIVVFGYLENFKPNLMCYIDEGLVNSRSLNASQLIRQIAKNIEGGGGGQAFFATAGGKNPEGLEKAIKEAIELINDLI